MHCGSIDGKALRRSASVERFRRVDFRVTDFRRRIFRRGGDARSGHRRACRARSRPWSEGRLAFHRGLRSRRSGLAVGAATGLAVVAHEFATLFVALKFAGAAYLAYVAWGLARSPAVDPDAASVRVGTGWRAFLGALSLTLGNPKVIVFFLSIMPLVVDLDAVNGVSIAEMAATCVTVISATLGAYALAANRARRWFRSNRAMTAVRRATAGVMAGVAVAIVTR
jgi:threonine/homoserine/homoserine lactone efflux protein